MHGRMEAAYVSGTFYLWIFKTAGMVGSHVCGVCRHNFFVESRSKLLSSFPQSETIDSGFERSGDVTEEIEVSIS
jgi:hypothetical protein